MKENSITINRKDNTPVTVSVLIRHHEVRGHNMRPQKERVITNDLEKDYYTIYEVAELLGFHHNTIRKMIKRGDLKAKQFNNREWRIKKVDLEEFTK